MTIKIPQVVKFFGVGLPAFLIAIPLNFSLVEYVGLAKPLAYAVVLVVQVFINFFGCILFVFKRDTSVSILKQFFSFMAIILIARSLDWALYSLLVSNVPIHYIALQLFNVVLFGLAKFAFARRSIEGSRLISPNVTFSDR